MKKGPNFIFLGKSELQARNADMRISEQEALDLFLKTPLDELCAMANAKKEARHGKNVFWVNNRQINYTNVCVLKCSFCSFSKIKKTDSNAYDWTLEEIIAKARAAVQSGAKELHIVGGLHPDHPFEYYLNMLATLFDCFHIFPSNHAVSFYLGEHAAVVATKGNNINVDFVANLNNISCGLRSRVSEFSLRNSNFLFVADINIGLIAGNLDDGTFNHRTLLDIRHRVLCLC